MSEDNKIPPPDDFSKTTPNISVPDADEPTPDWDKTNYNFPKQPEPDEWGKTVTNLRPIETGGQEMDKTFYPGSQAPSTPEWGMTAANINVNAADFGTRPDDFGGGQEYDKTTPYFQLPEAERAKYQNLPPTPAEQAAQAVKEEKEAGGVPGWVWVAAGLMTMFFFAIVVLGVVYLFILRDTSFELTVVGAPIGSTVTVDGRALAVTDGDGAYILRNLEAGKRLIAVTHPTFNCPSQEFDGTPGQRGKITIGCTALKATATDDCLNFQRGDDDKAERCYNSALDALPDPFTAEGLVRALNILIINFESGKSDVPPVRLAALQKGATFIKKLPSGIVLEVGGHTDNVGQAASNQSLSDARADAVKAVLVKFGVSDNTLQTRGYGPSKPITTNDTVDGKYRNRRIEYSIVKK